MKMIVTFDMFVNEFKRYNRKTNFSRVGLRALFDHLDAYDNDDMELDVIDLCCTYGEYTLKGLNNQYAHISAKNDEGKWRFIEQAYEDLSYDTDVIMVDNKRLIVREF